MANIRKLLEIAAQFVSARPYASVGDFISYIQHISMTTVREAEADPQVERDAVKLLTVHSVKGLEFEYVFHIDVREHEKKDRPQFLVDLSDDGEGQGVAIKHLPGGEGESRKYAAILERKKVLERSQAEERRIFYVALTRAKEALYLTTTRPDSEFFGEILAQFQNHPGVEILEIPEQS
jgi:ATP-dependent helicase/nuclease subunit A